VTLALIYSLLTEADLIPYHLVNLLSHLSVVSLSSLDCDLQLRGNEIYLDSG
jgi:hypothetical protein